MLENNINNDQDESDRIYHIDELTNVQLLDLLTRNKIEVDEQSLPSILNVILNYVDNDLLLFLIKDKSAMIVSDEIIKEMYYDFFFDACDKCAVCLIISMLKNNIIDVNYQNVYGDTALHVLASKSDENGVKELLTLGADKEIKNNTGMTAYDYAKENENENLMEILKYEGASQYDNDNDNECNCDDNDNSNSNNDNSNSDNISDVVIDKENFKLEQLLSEANNNPIEEGVFIMEGGNDTNEEDESNNCGEVGCSSKKNKERSIMMSIHNVKLPESNNNNNIINNTNNNNNNNCIYGKDSNRSEMYFTFLNNVNTIKSGSNSATSEHKGNNNCTNKKKNYNDLFYFNTETNQKQFPNEINTDSNNTNNKSLHSLSQSQTPSIHSRNKNTPSNPSKNKNSDNTSDYSSTETVQHALYYPYISIYNKAQQLHHNPNTTSFNSNTINTNSIRPYSYRPPLSKYSSYNNYNKSSNAINHRLHSSSIGNSPSRTKANSFTSRYAFGDSEKYSINTNNLEYNITSSLTVYSFLAEINIPQYTQMLLSNGFDDINLIINQTQFNISVSDKNLRDIGIRLPGDRAKILVRLEEKAGRFPYEIDKCKVYFNNESNSNGVGQMLKSIKMEMYYDNFIENGYNSVDLMLLQMLTRQPIDEFLLEEEIKVEKIGYRMRLLSKLKTDAEGYFEGKERDSERKTFKGSRGAKKGNVFNNNNNHNGDVVIFETKKSDNDDFCSLCNVF